MKLPAAWRREPTASRLLIVVGLLLVGLMVGVDFMSRWAPWLFFVPIGLIFVVVLLVVVVFVRRITATRMAFDLDGRAFLASPILPAGLFALLPIVLSSSLVSSIAMGERETWQILVAVPPLSLYTAWLALAARGLRFELNPVGIMWRTPIGSTSIPWEALAPGGPMRQPLSSSARNRVQLATLRPDLVVRKGWIILGGSHEYPVLQAQTSVHPWFLVDAIRWYAEHPEHRADIGTQSEHDRLLATLVPQLPPKPEIIRPPRPRTVSIALWLTWAGFAWGLLWSCWNLGLALTFEDRIRATAVASDDGLASTTAIGSTVWGLVLAAVVGIGAVALARSVRKGNDAARMGLLLLCGAIVLWAPCGSSLTAPMVMLDFDDLLGQLMTASFFGNQAVSVGLAVAILVLLTVEPSNRYFRPKA